jgi:hypothetical protein
MSLTTSSSSSSSSSSWITVEQSLIDSLAHHCQTLSSTTAAAAATASTTTSTSTGVSKTASSMAIVKCLETLTARFDFRLCRSMNEFFRARQTSLPYIRIELCRVEKQFSLLLMAWPPGATSPIHDHQGSKCWMTCVDGSLTEYRYERPLPLPTTTTTTHETPNVLDSNRHTLLSIDDSGKSAKPLVPLGFQVLSSTHSHHRHHHVNAERMIDNSSSSSPMPITNSNTNTTITSTSNTDTGIATTTPAAMAVKPIIVHIDDDDTDDPIVHGITNSSVTKWAFSLHLYSPPLDKMCVYDPRTSFKKEIVL